MKNKFIKISLLFIAVILMAITFYQIAKYEVINISAKWTELKAQNDSIPSKIIAGEDPSSYDYKTDTPTDWKDNGEYYDNIYQEGCWWSIVQYYGSGGRNGTNKSDDRMIFCIEPRGFCCQTMG